jgi:hypothetical protein
MMKILARDSSAEPLPYWFRSNVYFLFFKIFYLVFCSAKEKAVNGKANLRWFERIQFNAGDLTYIGR